MDALDAVGELAAKPPSCQSKPTCPRLGGSGQLIVGDVIDFEGAGIDIAQHEIGRAGLHRRNARVLPIQADRAQEGCAGDLVVIDIVHLQSTGIDVAQQEITFAAHAAEITDARKLPLQPDGADEGGVGDLVAGNVVDLQSAGIGIAQQHVAFAGAAEIADARELPISPTVPMEAALVIALLLML
jgi:hypothetical protein